MERPSGHAAVAWPEGGAAHASVPLSARTHASASSSLPKKAARARPSPVSMLARWPSVPTTYQPRLSQWRASYSR
ncbi:protein of unknown function [Streptantibioticus cattleyicolor NRRL 8057 = DSM 46488]|nr:protein of unknown function [Streptantibioticus cattleyicolor NRRL 8057 = DSM 46488]